MLAREVGPKLYGTKPVVISHHMVLGLNAPKKSYDSLEDRVMDLKMSKSKPNATIFMTDTFSQIKMKIKKAYCPESIEDNPILDYAQYFVFERFDKMKIERSMKFGGDIEFNNFDDLAKAFSSGELHPADIKNSVAFYLNELVKPIRDAFDSNQKLAELRDTVLGYQVTR